MAFDRTIWARPAVDLHQRRDRRAVVERLLILAIGLVVGFVAGLVAIG